MSGGRWTSWRVGSIVLKPLDVPSAELEWQARVLSTVDPQGVRLVLPLRSAQGDFAVEGWVATPFVKGVHEPGRWLDILAVWRRLGTALADLARPAFLDDRTSARAIADAVAWGERADDEIKGHPHIEALLDLRRPIAGSPQVIHGDLAGNVLFAKGMAPAVIDFAAYWRPAAYASAIIVADAIVWEGAPDALVASLAGGEDAGQYLVRALVFRAIVEVLQRPSLDPTESARPYWHAIEIAKGLEGR